MPINQSAVSGTIAIGIGYSQLSELCATMDIPCMSSNTFLLVQEDISQQIHTIAEREMEIAGEEERRLAIESGSIDTDGTPMCTVVADGQWSKRSYKTNYDALSGVATIIGYKSKKILFIGVRNRYCAVCQRAKNKGIPKPEHSCFLNWSKGATSMEADSIAEGFKRSMELHGLKYNKLIGDGDSSVKKRLSEIMPYGPKFHIQKIECRNHLLRNYGTKLSLLAKNIRHPYLNLRKHIQSNIIRFRNAIVKSIEYRSQLINQSDNDKRLGKRINFSQRQSYNTRVEAAVVSYNTSGEFLRKLHKNVVNEKSPGDIGKKYLKTKRMKSEKRKCKKLLFSKKVKKFSKQTGPDQHYGLAEPLLDDIPLNELESKKSAFILSLYLDHDKRIELEIKTREQANSQIWHTERRNRITGSNFGRICKMRPTTLCRSTVYDMLYRSFTSKSTDYGKAMENKAIIVFQNGFNCAVEPCGLIVDDDLHYLAATPDGLVGTDYVVEIKCPLKAKDSSSFIEAVMNKKITFCRIQNENEMELKKEHNYYYQIQGQMHVSKRKFCYFVVYTANWYKVQIIEYDESFWSNKMTLLTTPWTASTFNYDLCKALLCSNIPLFKLSQPSFRSFLEKYTNKIIPDQSTLCKKYVNECYEETINNIRAYVSEKKIWVSIDETTDVAGRYVANVIIGTLEIDNPGKIFLLNSEVLDKTNYATICRLFDNSLLIVWPEGIRRENILLFLSDAAPYMVKAGKSLKIFNPKMEHITCLAHALHRVCEEIRLQFPKVDKLISNMKKIFLKAPSQKQIFRNIAPNIPLPPEPILTRWGTWINAAIYYCEHFLLIKRVVMELDEDDAISIKKSL
ncbi:hypothetical protein QTP88_022868 [Uroleucon formosanum]